MHRLRFFAFVSVAAVSRFFYQSGSNLHCPFKTVDFSAFFGYSVLAGLQVLQFERLFGCNRKLFSIGIRGACHDDGIDLIFRIVAIACNNLLNSQFSQVIGVGKYDLIQAFVSLAGFARHLVVLCRGMLNIRIFVFIQVFQISYYNFINRNFVGLVFAFGYLIFHTDREIMEHNISILDQRQFYFAFFVRRHLSFSAVFQDSNRAGIGSAV